MRKSKYLVLSSLYYKFNDELTNIQRTTNFIDLQNIIDLLRFDKLFFISSHMFCNMNINFVYFPNGLKNIGIRSFNENQIKYINISNCSSLNYVDNSSFKTNKLIYLDLSKNTKLTKLSVNVFDDNNIKRIKLPNGITIINANAFSNNYISYLDLSDTITILIKNHSFQYNNINIIKLPLCIKNIDAAFMNNKIEFLDLTKYKDIVLIDKYSFSYNPLKEIKINNDVNIIYYTENNILNKKDLWNEFAIYYNETGKRAGDYKYENGKWEWYPL